VANPFKLVSTFEPAGDQPKAIDQLTAGLEDGMRYQTLLGVTGSGKTFTMAHTIARIGLPTLVMAPNKTLAAQLANELRTFFPENAVEYFVSYYDYYQPEAYLPQTDTYIEKDSSINEEVEKLRHAATASLYSREDVIVVASVSCIYGLGSPEDYEMTTVMLEVGGTADRDEVLRKLVDIRYERNDYSLVRGAFRVRGDTLEVFPAYADKPLRVQFFGDEVEGIQEMDPVTGELTQEFERQWIFPATHYVTVDPKVQRALATIQEELTERLAQFDREGKLLEAQRLKMRTEYDLEMLETVGFCTGIENYSRHLSGKKPGEPPDTLLDYFPDDFLVIIDESHVTVPQVGGMYEGDRSRKLVLVEHGFRLPSALDNRPLRFDEFEARVPRFVYVSATPADYELSHSTQVVEQIIRPTGLVDPEVLVRPIKGQIDDLIGECRGRAERDERVLVTTLTKKMAEDLADYLLEMGLKVRYLHSDIGTMERVEILSALRSGEFDVLVGVNLLREGLDLPEVSLVAILDADKEGFLRNERSLIQTIGRAARNVSGQVIMYADDVTDSMRRAIGETDRRRVLQTAHNQAHGITPQTIMKAVTDIVQASRVQEGREAEASRETMLSEIMALPAGEVDRIVMSLEEEMTTAAAELDFELAAQIRDQLFALKAELDDRRERGLAHGGVAPKRIGGPKARAHGKKKHFR